MRNWAFVMDSISVVARAKWFIAFARQARLSSSPAASRKRTPAAVFFRWFGVCTVVIAVALGMSVDRSARADALERLEPERLKAVHEAVAELKSQRQELDRSGPYQDYRAAIHLHSAFSHDSRGTLKEIVAAAKATGTTVLMFTEHPSDDYDPPVNGHHGMHDGVLLIPGVESKGFLVFPTQSLKGNERQSPQEYADQVRSKGGLVFLSHVEERMDWEIEGMTGTEIYNTHADFSEEETLIAKMKNPLGMFQMMGRFQKYPQEAFGALLDYPAGYLKKWDELCQQKPHTGVAAPDSHQNVGLYARLLDGGKVRLEDALGKKLMELNLKMLPMLQPLAEGKKPGDSLFEFQMDPYPSSFLHVGTHLLMTELSEKAVREALEAGRAYVSFDWIADATGFDFAAVSASGRHEMGSQFDYADGLQLQAQAPLPVEWRLMRNGEVVTEAEGPSFKSPVDEPGCYRVEAWLDVGGEKRIWILSNPVYVRSIDPSAAKEPRAPSGSPVPSSETLRPESIGCGVIDKTVKATMDEIVSRIYATVEPDALAKIDEEAVRQIVTDAERQVLATKYWCFDVNVPVVVSVLRHDEQKIIPFWLPEAGFRKTQLTARNEHNVYEIWQKKFDAGRVELGINGFDRHRPHYVVSVGPQSPEDNLELTNFFPEKQTVLKMREGSLTYHDWTELVLLEVPQSLRGHSLLTTVRGRSREAHLIGAFRKTPFPSSEKPDLINLTWSDDPRTTQTVQWRTNLEVPDGVVRYRERDSGAGADLTEIEATCTQVDDRLLCNDRFCHRFTALLHDLKPATTYVYRVGSPVRDSWSDQRKFTTASDTGSPFSFIYLGDTHRSPIPGQLLRKALEACPDAAFCTLAGDLVGTGLYRDEWDQLFTYLNHFSSERPLVPAIGNHDDQEGLGASMYLTMFALPENGPSEIGPERAYHFRYGNALVAVLDIASPLEPQAAWLDEVLSKTDARWKFVMLHFPPYTLSDEYEDLGQVVTQLCDKHHVDVVMNGHIHVYLRSHPMKGGRRMDKPSEGTTYITSAAVPGREFERKMPDWVAAFLSGPALYQTFEIDGDRCVYRACDLEGRVRDEMVIEK